MAITMVGCEYDDSAVLDRLDDLESRVTTLEQLCQQMNTNISSLQSLVSALQQNDYITSVAPIKQGNEVIGYTITFAKGEPITIYHGQNGKDGKDGKDGYTPVIGVSKDEDGVYYWTLDGEWLTDADGNKIATSGKDGEDGADGEGGAGSMPELKIQGGYWYVSYDGGENWERLGRATGYDGSDGKDGQDGQDGKDGDSFFLNVNVEDDYIVFILDDGTSIIIPRSNYVVTSNDEFMTALSSDDKVINIVLDADVTIDVKPWNDLPIGNENTKIISIDGQSKHKITFNQINSDWNHITTNGAKLIIKNAHLTNSGNNNGPWNRHDLNFACDVELENVTSDKAIALKAGGKLTKVTINDANTSDTYALWIQSNGQTVTLDGCIIDMLGCSDGRGIKIDTEYATTPVKVTLNVSNTIFKTEEKAAVIVDTSTAGAEINWGTGNNISQVAADSVNAVWVDKDSSASFDLVVVKGASKKQES